MHEKVTFTIANLLERPLFQEARLAAGTSGGSRKIGWVHVLEITHVSPFVNRNDLILSTGIWLHQPLQERTDYLLQLIAQEAAGLCVELGTSIEVVPPEIIELAEQHHFPLIVFDKPVRFVEITQDIHSLLINQHHQLLKDLERYSRSLQQLTAQTSDIKTVLRLFHRSTNRAVAYISSLESSQFVPSVTTQQAEQMEAYYSNIIEPAYREGKEAELLFELGPQVSVLFHPVVCFGQIFSAVGVFLSSSSPTESLSLFLDHTAKAIATLILRTQYLEEKGYRTQNDLLRDIINGEIESEEQAQASMNLPLLNKERYLFVAGIVEIVHGNHGTSAHHKESIQQDLLVLTRSLLRKQGLISLVMPKGNQLYMLIAKEAITSQSKIRLAASLNEISDDLQAFAIRLEDKIQVRTGYSKAREQLSAMPSAYKEALQTLELARSVPSLDTIRFYEQMGAYQLLKAIPGTSLLRTFVQDHLGELISFEQQHRLQLLETLDIYLQCSGSKTETTRRLYIHRQTLYNRLEKLNDILGDDFMDQNRRVCLELALMAHRMLQMGS